MKRLMFFLIVACFFSSTGVAQPAPFTAGSIPLVQGEVVFTVNFQTELSQDEFHKIAYRYMKDTLNPYSGIFLQDDEKNTVCLVTDYLSMVNGALQSFGMYMTYRLELSYRNGLCKMVIRDIHYMEKTAYEATQHTQPRTRIPSWSAKDIMVDHKYHLLLIRNVSERVTHASLERINKVVKGLYASFVRA